MGLILRLFRAFGNGDRLFPRALPFAEVLRTFDDQARSLQRTIDKVRFGQNEPLKTQKPPKPPEPLKILRGVMDIFGVFGGFSG